MAPCGCFREKTLPNHHGCSKDARWKCLYTRFFRFSLAAVVIFLGMQYGFSALVTRRQLVWLHIRNMYAAVTTYDKIQQEHNVTGVAWNSTVYTGSHLQNDTVRRTTVPAGVHLRQTTTLVVAVDPHNNTTAAAQRTTQIQVANTQTTLSITQTTTVAHTTMQTQVTSVNQTTALPRCPPLPPNLVGKQQISLSTITQEQLETKHPHVLPGGQWRPLECESRHRVALIIPYRNRESHLRIFLNHMHPFLQKQQLDYGIYIVEQAPGSKFNRAMLMNIGFVEASKLYDYQCFIFHDVDLLPEDDRNIYSCPEQPRHMSAAVDVMRYRLPYLTIFGGVAAMKTKHFRLVNGFSNQFFGWGGEDDDLYNRIHHHKLDLIRYPLNIARYTMMKHKKDVANPQRFKILYSGRSRFRTDGLNSLKYKLLDLTKRKLCTWIRVQIDKSY